MSKAEIIAAVEDTWRAFRDSFERLTTSDLEVAHVAGEWSIKDIVGHVAAWDQELAYLVVGREPGKDLTRRRIDSFNRQQVEKRDGRPVSEVLTELGEVRRLLRDALQSAPDEYFEAASIWRRRIDSYSIYHHQEHTAEIQLWIDRTRRGWRPYRESRE
ncbi:MAG: DinB family protein [SAR202 cluster bacterium]|nr:DinB family protein [SAR202 cluster bacterium]